MNGFLCQDELEAELEELEGSVLEDQLLQPATSAPIPELPSVAVKQPARPHKVPAQPSAEDEELAALQAEMAL